MIGGLLARLARAPDFVIGREGSDYLRRWWLIPRNRWFNVYLHQLCRDDDDRAAHDHPWWNVSIILGAGYVEVCQVDRWPDGGAAILDHAARPVVASAAPVHWNYLTRRKIRPRFAVICRRATTAHRLEALRDRDGNPIPSWSLFITGPVSRRWGFWTEAGWVHWKAFTNRNSRDPGDGVRDTSSAGQAETAPEAQAEGDGPISGVSSLAAMPAATSAPAGGTIRAGGGFFGQGAGEREGGR